MKLNAWIIACLLLSLVGWVAAITGIVRLFHQCPPPTRLNIQYHWQEVHDPNWKIKNTLDSDMLDRCSIECQPDYWKEMER